MSNKKAINKYISEKQTNPEISLFYECQDGESFEVKVKTTMTPDEKSTFVNRVVNGCFDAEDEYNPEFRETIFQITILQMLTDVTIYSKKIDEIDEYENPTGKKVDIVDTLKTYELCNRLDIINRINDFSFIELCEELVDCIDEKIQFKQQRILMGERRYFERMRNEMENGIALINSIADGLNGTLNENIANDDVIKTSNEFAKRIESMSDEELIKNILK